MFSDKKMKSAIETMLFIQGEPLEIKEMAQILEADSSKIIELCLELQKEYEEEGRGIRIRRINDSFGYITHKENEIFIQKLCTPIKIKRLSQSALEVMAIVAYKQPVTRGEIDSIRGIKSERVLDGLLAKNLVKISGKSDGVGRPLLYSTTDEFLKKFGFENLNELPDIFEFDDANIDGDSKFAQLEMNFNGDKEDENK